MATHYKGSAAEKRALDLFIKLMRTHDAMSAHLRIMFDGFGIPPSLFGILETLYHLGPMQQHELAAKLLQTPGNITRILDKLELERLIERRAEPGDRRCHRIALTKQGQKRIRTILPEFSAAINRLFSALNTGEQKQLDDLLRKAGKSLMHSLKK